MDNQLYIEDLDRTFSSTLPWEKLKGKHILVAGGTGLIGRYLIDLIMYMNNRTQLGCFLTVFSRNERAAKKVFPEKYFQSEWFTYIEHNVCDPLNEDIDRFDYIINLASNTHPRSYSERPIDTILSNVYGTKNLLDICLRSIGCRFVFLSSVEVYGENRGDVELFDEMYLGFLNSNTLRAGYPESKRVCEALCQAYIKEHNVDIVIPRLPRVFGPTMQSDDSKAVAQFIKKAVVGENIVLKSEGNQFYSFLYVADAVLGILTVMLLGKTGNAYNIADELCDDTLKNIAEMCADVAQVEVIFELPDAIEKKGYSTATKARLDSSKIKKLGWKNIYSLKEGIERTINIQKNI
jgi:nucleoside-diphosphate-sugar epimerase